MFKERKRLFGFALVAAVIVGAGTAFAFAAGDDDEALTGSTYDRAVAAAQTEVGGGEVLETEGGDGGAAYGVEIRQDDGTVVEVELDENFEVISVVEEDDDQGDTDDD